MIVRVEFPEDMAQPPFSPAFNSETRQAFTEFSWNPPNIGTATNYTVHLGTDATNLTQAASTTNTSVVIDLRDHLPDYSPEAFWRVDVETAETNVTGAVVQFSYVLSVIGDPDAVVGAGRADPRVWSFFLGVAPPLPYFLGEVKLHLSARAIESLTITTNVQRWADLSGNGNDLISSAATYDAGENPFVTGALVFENTLPITFMENTVAVMVVDWIDTNQFSYIIGNPGVRHRYSYSTGQFQAAPSRVLRQTATGTATAGRTLWVGQHLGTATSTNILVWKNGVPLATTSAGTSGGEDLSGITGMGSIYARIHEFFIIGRDTALSQHEIDAINGYSQNNWGTP